MQASVAFLEQDEPVKEVGNRTYPCIASHGLVIKAPEYASKCRAA